MNLRVALVDDQAQDADEAELRAFAAADPVVTTGTARLLIGTMLAGFVRPEQRPEPQQT